MNTVMRLAFVPGATCIERTVGSNGAVSVVDLERGEAGDRSGSRAGAVWTASTGRPWGTVLFARRRRVAASSRCTSTAAAPTTAVRVETRPEVGIPRGIEASGNGSVFVIDELNGGSVYDKGRRAGLL